MIHAIIEISKDMTTEFHLAQISNVVYGCLKANETIQTQIKTRVHEVKLLADEIDSRHFVHVTVKAKSDELNIHDKLTPKSIAESIQALLETLKAVSTLPSISVEMVEMKNYFELT